MTTVTKILNTQSNSKYFDIIFFNLVANLDTEFLQKAVPQYFQFPRQIKIKGKGKAIDIIQETKVLGVVISFFLFQGCKQPCFIP